MVRELDIPQASAADFPRSAPAANPVFFRTYSRRTPAGRETWAQTVARSLDGLVELGGLTEAEEALLARMMLALKSLPSGRWLWVGGTDWSTAPVNFSGAYNCTSTNVRDWSAFGLMMDLAMMGCGTGAVLESRYIQQLPVIRNFLQVEIVATVGARPAALRHDETVVDRDFVTGRVGIQIGDSRQGWVDAYQALLELASDAGFAGRELVAAIDLSHVRPAGEILKGFGGMANPVKLPELFPRLANVLNGANGRQLDAKECCLLVDEAAACIVAGNIRRCLPEDALVHTARGLVPIAAVRIGDLVQTPIGFRRVVDKFDQGIQDIREIETNGPLPRATENHRMAVLAGAKGEITWKRVAELEAGDRLLHSTAILPGTVTHLPDDFTAERPPNSSNAKALTIPALTAEVAWLIGYTHGDGYVALGRNKHDKPYGRVEWSMNANQDALTARLQRKLDGALSQFGLSATHGIVRGESTAKSVCSSIRLAEYFQRHIKQPNQPLAVPAFILQGAVDVRAAYLAGLMDSDGAARNRPPHLVTTVYAGFVRQVAAVLSSLGIAGRLHLTKPQEEHWRTRYHLTLPALKHEYNNLIAPHSVKGELRQGLKMYGFTLPGVLMREAYTYSEMRDMGFQGSRQVDANYERYRAESELEIDIPISVAGLGSYDSVRTYDIEVEEAHCFYCDGYLTHNSAGMRQFDADSPLLKENLWQPDAEGNWRIDPERDALRMANHTRIFHARPTQTDLVEAVRKQYYSGEGAIQWAGEAVARASADLWESHPERRSHFIEAYARGEGPQWLQANYPQMPVAEVEHRLQRYGLNPCGEIIGADFHCNLAEVHLNQLDPQDFKEQEEAFHAGAVAVAALLNHQFVEPRYQKSRELDPIVGVSFTGLFDFFVKAFGLEWLEWWAAGRPETPEGLAFKRREREYLQMWRQIVRERVWEYCDRRGLKRPNRYTTVQPAGTKSLLTGASPGWHPPKAARFVRRVTFRKNDPVALACIDYGYSVVPSQSDKDERGNLLDDPFDPRCTEWLVEIPVAVSWADIPGCDTIDLSRFSVAAQFDFAMQVQRYYVTHNTSSTLELREGEIEELGALIYRAIENNEGYISAALLARFDDLQTFPRLPFEPISRETYQQFMQAIAARRTTDDFYGALLRYDRGERLEAGPAGCDSDKCLLPERKP